MIGAELGLEPIGSVAKGCGHNSGVSDNRVEGFAFRQQSIVGSSSFELVELDLASLKNVRACAGD